MPFLEMFQYDFMQRAFLAGMITAIICPLLGMFVVVRRQAMIGDGLGHIAFAGVTGGYLAGIYPAAGAFVLTIAGAAGIELVRRRRAQMADTALAVFFYAGIALAIIFSTITRMPSAGLLGFLFGSILTVSWQDVMVIAGCGLVVLAFVFTNVTRLMLVAFDEEVARVAGIRTDAVNMALSIVTAITVVTGMMVVGILMVSALMIVPVAAAEQLGKGFKATMTWAVGLAVLAVVGGLTAAFYLDIAPGGSIIMTVIIFYILIAAARRLRYTWRSVRRTQSYT
ncbi:metal ABC transporter permease [Sporomusa termitida]|uniref:High-affinity zinc uptake system membrane protein ZnuB n=1 Tax=Sporomusa termitida TaxID=2377 RepID=A0A517DS55_9FIRM|nr:metal ABC transporter permease [Sporomusa termitida]QDR80190.1 High-affinity zinc uptake system membrane protein ZnuB [Sporomusa termitida]